MGSRVYSYCFVSTESMQWNGKEGREAMNELVTSPRRRTKPASTPLFLSHYYVLWLEWVVEEVQ
jgi:hypothetical protein